MGEKNSGAARATTKTRTAEKNGRPVRFGRPRIERPAVYARVRAGFEAGELSGGDAARACGVSRATFARWVQADRTTERVGSTA